MKTKQEKSWAQEAVVEKIKKGRLPWFGHVEWMEGERLYKSQLYMDL